jgi:hypothetical protein
MLQTGSSRVRDLIRSLSFLYLSVLRTALGPEVYSNRNEYEKQKINLEEVEPGRRVRLTSSPPSLSLWSACTACYRDSFALLYLLRVFRQQTRRQRLWTKLNHVKRVYKLNSWISKEVSFRIRDTEFDTISRITNA